MSPIIPMPPQVQATVTQTLVAMPIELITVIAGYAATRDFSQLHRHKIWFDQDGTVTNPELREAYKEAFMSAYCPPNVKSLLMQYAFSRAPGSGSPRLQDEFRRIFDEIVSVGERVIFDNTCLSDLILAAVNWQRISLVDADLSNTELIDVNISDADLSNLEVADGLWLEVNAENAILSGVDLNELRIATHLNLNNVVGLENWPAPFTGHPIRICPPGVTHIVVDCFEALPTRALEIILRYLGQTDYSAISKQVILFDQAGNVTNPLVRQGYKDAFMASDCSAQIKSILMEHLFAPPDRTENDRLALEREGIAIFNEIVESGHRAYLDDIVLRGFVLQSINWFGASIREANLIDTQLINVDLRQADARDLFLLGGEWTNVNLEGAQVTETDFEDLRVMDQVNLDAIIHAPDME